MIKLSRRLLLGAAALLGLAAATTPSLAQVKEIRIDWATYNPVGLVLKDKGLLEQEFKADGINIRWVQSLGSNKALEFLNADSLDFGSTAGAAALIGKINGNPIRSVYVYSRPEWTALVAPKGSSITKPADLKGKRIAVTRGTDPHIFLIQALAGAGLSEKDVKIVLLQHPDGRLALQRGDVDAWAGLDPLMAAAEVDEGATLFYRRPELNSWGVLNVREDFAAKNPALVKRVLSVYEKARELSLKEPATLKASLLAAAKLPEPVIARQLERTDLSESKIGDKQKKTILDAGIALQQAGVIEAKVDVKAVVDALIDGSYSVASR